MLLLAVSRILMGDSGHEPLALARLACDVGTDQGPEAAVCRNVLALLELDARETEDHSGTGFAARGASIVMLAANMTRTPDVPLPEIPNSQPQRRCATRPWSVTDCSMRPSRGAIGAAPPRLGDLSHHRRHPPPRSH